MPHRASQASTHPVHPGKHGPDRADTLLGFVGVIVSKLVVKKLVVGNRDGVALLISDRAPERRGAELLGGVGSKALRGLSGKLLRLRCGERFGGGLGIKQV